MPLPTRGWFRIRLVVAIFWTGMTVWGCGFGSSGGSPSNNAPPDKLIDTTPPTSAVACSPLPNTEGWNPDNVECELAATDHLDGAGIRAIHYRINADPEIAVPGDRVSLTFTDEGETTLIYFAVDRSNNQEQAKAITILIDKSLPSISGVLSPEPNNNGWNVSDITVKFVCLDAFSGIVACPTDQIVTREGKGQIITASTTDRAGHKASASLIVNVDKTPPIVSSTIPTDDVSDVDINTEIEATFSEELDISTLTPGTFIVKAAGGNVQGDLTLNGSTVIFKPHLKLFLSTSYTVTLTDGIRDFAGHPLIQHEWRFATRERAWRTPLLIETDDTPASSLRLAADAVGNALAIWVQGDDIWSNRHVIGSGWNPNNTLRIEANTLPARDPQVAMDANGNGMAIWTQDDGIWTNTFAIGSEWNPGSAERIDADTGIASRPSVAMGSNTNAVAVWEQPGDHLQGSPDDRDGVWANHSLISSGWSQNPTDLRCAGCLVSAASPHVAGDGLGNAMAVWVQNGHLWANRYVFRSAWSRVNSIQIESNNGPVSNPFATMDSFGNAMVVWIQNGHLWANRYEAGSLQWGTAFQVEDNVGNASMPDAAMDDFGTAVFVWSQNGDIWANRYLTGSGLSPLNASRIEANEAAAVGPKVTIDGSGNAMAVWAQDKGVWANRYVIGRGWQSEVLISPEITETTDAPSYPHVITDISGNAVAVWIQPDDMSASIWANRFD
jgi:hypothetical protein